MGKIASAATIYATAYLTEKGRAYLFNKGNIRFDVNGNDLFEIKKFALGDPDANYKTPERLISGDVPDITGKSEGCLKATADYIQTTLSYFTVDALAFVVPIYTTNLIGNTLTINTDVTFPLNSPSDVPPTTPGGTGTGTGTGVVGSGTEVVGSGTGAVGGFSFGSGTGVVGGGVVGGGVGTGGAG